jgi:putative ABC transport system permease protein
MRMLALALHHVVARPLRSLLTVAGIAVASGGAFAVAGLIQGVQVSLEGGLNEAGVDLIVSERNSFSLVGGALPQALGGTLANVSGVEAVSGVLFNMATAGQDHFVPVAGWPRASFLWRTLNLSAGRLPADHERWGAVLGESLAEALGKRIGDKIEIHFQQYDVVGIARFSSFLNRNIAIVPQEGLQELMNRQGAVTFFQVRLARPLTPERAAAVRAGLAAAAGKYAVYSTGEFASELRLLGVIRAVAAVISLIMLGLTALLVANTLLMAVSERTYDIGVLMSLGWSDARILALVLLEGLILTCVGVGLGIGLGFAVMHGAARLNIATGYLQAYTTGGGIATIVMLTLLVGFLGTLYPAWRATRLDPVEALRRN